MRRRAENVDETRRRIVEAAVALHGSVGPAGTTVLGVADRAGVTRATVYRHFPDDDALFTACSNHWLGRQIPPNPAAWAAVMEPSERLRAGLTDLYRFYRAGETMLTRIYHDVAVLPEGHRRRIRERDGQMRDVLLAAYPAGSRRSARLRAVIGHAVSFWTWRSLCIDEGLSDEDAVRVMVDLVARSAERT